MQSIALELAEAHAAAVDVDMRDNIGIPGLWSPDQAATYRLRMFEKYGISGKIFGGTFGGLPKKSYAILWCGGVMVARNKFLFFGIFIFIIVGYYFWIKTNVGIEIDKVKFDFPAQAVVSYSREPDGLDGSSGVAISLPGGPYYNDWQILLQSRRDRRGDGMPIGFKDDLLNGTILLSQSSFGWLEYNPDHGREKWFFKRMPGMADSTYSVGTITCFNKNICILFLSYRELDVQVSIERRKVGEISKVMRDVINVLKMHDVTAE